MNRALDVHRQSRRSAAQDQQQYEAQMCEQQQAYAPPPAPAAPPPAAAPPPDPIAQLRELGELHAQGILTDEEFAGQKAKVLGS